MFPGPSGSPSPTYPWPCVMAMGTAHLGGDREPGRIWKLGLSGYVVLQFHRQHVVAQAEGHAQLVLEHFEGFSSLRVFNAA